MQIEITTEYLTSQGLSKTFSERFWRKVDKNGPVPDPAKYPLLKTRCWRWSAHKAGGLNQDYGYIGRCGEKSGKETAHRASWILHFGPIPDGLSVLHKCDFPECTNPEHIFLGTPKQNTHDMMQKGRMIVGNHSGERNGRATVTWKIVHEIRAKFKPWIVTRKHLAELYGLSPHVVKEIVRHKTWKKESCPSGAIPVP